MRVALGNYNAVMTEQRTHCFNVRAALDEPGRERVPKVMEA